MRLWAFRSVVDSWPLLPAGSIPHKLIWPLRREPMSAPKELRPAEHQRCCETGWTRRVTTPTARARTLTSWTRCYRTLPRAPRAKKTAHPHSELEERAPTSMTRHSPGCTWLACRVETSSVDWLPHRSTLHRRRRQRRWKRVGLRRLSWHGSSRRGSRWSTHRQRAARVAQLGTGRDSSAWMTGRSFGRHGSSPSCDVS